MATATVAKPKKAAPAPAPEPATGAKLIVSSSALLALLTRVARVVPSNPVVPVLANILLRCESGALSATASDLETTLIAGPLPVETRQEPGEAGAWAVCAPARILLDTLKTLPDQPITVTVDLETHTIELASTNGRFRFTGETATDFPRVPVIQATSSLELPSTVLARAFNKTLFAASTDELRPAMTGVRVKMEGKHLAFVTTDGHRLCRYRREHDANGLKTDMQVIIPRKACAFIRATLPTEAVPVAMSFSASNALFTFEGLSVICGLIDERYPDYENVIPAHNPNKLLVDRQDLLASVKRISIYADKTTHRVRLRLAGAELHVSAEDLGYSCEANERLACQYEGDEMEIGFDAKLLVEMLTNTDSPEVAFSLSTPNRAGLLTPAEQEPGEDVLMLLMPVMLNNYV